MSAMPTEANGSMLSRVHFGDLHITGEDEQNYRDFLALIEDVNTHLAGHIDFAVLPGDNADDGSEEQFRLVRRATGRLRIPLHILPGDLTASRATSTHSTRILAPSSCRRQ
jgi:Icc protein